MPIDIKSNKAKRWIIATVALASMVAYCAPPGTFRRIDFELTGRVLDKETGEPLEGAYVVAVYLVREYGIAVISEQCKKTKGTYSGKDGTYRLPVDKLDGLSPQDVTAIRPGYYGQSRVIPSIQLQHAQTRETYSNRDIYLTKQDLEKPNFSYGDLQEDCSHAEYRDDVEASVKFGKIALAEVERLGGEPWLIENIKRRIGRLEARPSRQK